MNTIPAMEKRPQLPWLQAALLLLWIFAPGGSLPAGIDLRIDDSTRWRIDPLFRAFLLNDQRIQWSGLETTFGAEAAIGSSVQRSFRGGTLTIGSEFYLNQPFDKNILRDAYRMRYAQNFEREIVSISQLFLRVSSGKFSFAMGKCPTVFGKTYAPEFSNACVDQPFIRNEVILRRETGLFFSFSPWILELDLAVVNGCENLDTNSSKPFVARAGLKGKAWALGVSAKTRNGTGSEQQKQYKSHVGIDGMAALGKWRFSAEVIADEYGLHHPFPEDQIFWPRSFYYRDIFFAENTFITGIGGYIDVQVSGKRWLVSLNYGEYHPKKIGNPLHDEINRRFLVKYLSRFRGGWEAFAAVLVENDRPREPVFSGASPYAFILGMQAAL